MSVTFCLIDGCKAITEYDAACQIGNNAYDLSVFKYLGDGVIYSVNGCRYIAKTRLSFFREK